MGRYAAPSLTDRETSVESTEFSWDQLALTQTHAIVLDPIISKLQSNRAVSVLDIGCGNGAASIAIANRGFAVVGIDSSSSGIDLATSRQSGVQFNVHHIEQPLTDELRRQFDAVVAIEVIEHLFKPRELLHRAAEALRPDGVLILTTPYHGYLKNLALALFNKFDHHVHPLRDYGHIKFFSMATIAQIMSETGFRVESIKRVGRVPVIAKTMIVTARFGDESGGRGIPQ